MTLSELRTQFTERLLNTYTKEEAQSLFFIFLEHYTSLRRIDFLSAKGEEVKETSARLILEALEKLAEGIPYQHLVEEVEFAGLRIRVSADALIPRPETEELVYLIRDHYGENQKPSKVLDIGTGTACIALACAHFFPDADVSGIDISTKALRLAQTNAALNSLSVKLREVDFLNQYSIEGEWDLIVSNPPYIAESEAGSMQPLVTEQEPHQALFVPDDDPLLFYRRIYKFSKENLTKGGRIFLEINERLGIETLRLFDKPGFEAEIRKDLSGKERFIVVKRT